MNLNMIVKEENVLVLLDRNHKKKFNLQIYVTNIVTEFINKNKLIYASL